LYGEDLVYCQPFFDKSPEDFLSALAEVNFDKVNEKQKNLKIEQQKRGLKMRIVS
jgi:hypothetical protein